MSSRKAFLFVGIFCIAVFGLALAGDIPEPTIANLKNDDSADFADYVLLANNWQQTGAGLAGDFDDSNAVDIDDLMFFSWYWLTEYSEYQQCQGTDLDIDGIIAFEDLAKLAQHWLLSGEGFAGDFDDSNSVDCNDLSVMADCWLKGSRPKTVFEQFKTALATDNVNQAVSYFAPVSVEKYRLLLEQLRPQFSQMISDMGELIPISIDKQTARYDLLREEDGEIFGYPVTFIKDEFGEWKISDF